MTKSRKMQRNNLLKLLLVWILLSVTIALLKFVFIHKNSMHIIEISDTGFSPETLFIKKGDTVVWVISGKNARWPASDPHPIHNNYPVKGGCIGSKLDSCRPLKPGEEYSFKFDMIGNWGIHDHLSPGLSSSISVTDTGKNVIISNHNAGPFRSLSQAK